MTMSPNAVSALAFAAIGSLFALPSALAQAVTFQEKISAYEPADFVLHLGGPEADDLTDGYQSRSANVATLPALEGYGVSYTLINLEPCAINLPHVHPRATELTYAIEGDFIRVAFVEENGGDGAVVNDIAKGDTTFFPMGLIHYQQNLACSSATLLAALSSDDPGTVTITSRFFELPTDAIQASLDLETAEIEALIASLPDAPANARLKCLEQCGSTYTSTTDTDYSYSY